MVKRILLACAGGYSTSMLVDRMRAVAKVKGLDVIIDATPESSINKLVEQADIIMLGPQLGHAEEGLRKKYGSKLPITTIDMMDYGMMDGEKVLDVALKLLK